MPRETKDYLVLAALLPFALIVAAVLFGGAGLLVWQLLSYL